MSEQMKKMKADELQVGGDFYKQMDIQPWDAIQAWSTTEQFEGYLLGQAIAYLARYNVVHADGKGGKQDLQKAEHYIRKLIETLD